MEGSQDGGGVHPLAPIGINSTNGTTHSPLPGQHFWSVFAAFSQHWHCGSPAIKVDWRTCMIGPFVGRRLRPCSLSSHAPCSLLPAPCSPAPVVAMSMSMRKVEEGWMAGEWMGGTARAAGTNSDQWH